MRAITRSEYGSPEVLSVTAVPCPVPAQNEVLIAVRASSVNAADRFVMRGIPYLIRGMTGLSRPKAAGMGQDFAGVVEAVGDGVARFTPGDRVFGQLDMGSLFAEFAAVPEDVVAHMPANVSFEQAAAVPLSGLSALQALRDAGRLVEGQSVLIIGASGAVGIFAVQVARALGGEVTGVCSTRNLDLVREAGAERVIDSTAQDFASLGHEYDLILDIVGGRPFSEVRRALAPKGTYVPLGGPEGRWFGPMGQILGAVTAGMFASQRVAMVSASPNVPDLTFLAELMEQGKVAPVITV